jgi:ElaA protein
MAIHERAFDDLGPHELYALLALRQRVFVVEQACVYLDLDGHDQRARHVWVESDRLPVAYARALPPGEKYEEASIGRVVSAPEARRTGAGRAVVGAAIEVVERAFGSVPIRISAQAYLERFYRGFGFVTVSPPYDEDGIPHVAMVRSAQRA